MATFMNVTEESSLHNGLEKMSVNELLRTINEEDEKVAIVVRSCIPDIERLVTAITDKMLAGGRLFYIGAGTSGRLGILDASEIPPTYGLPAGCIIGVIAGGEKAIQSAVENAEDNSAQGWKDLENYKVSPADVVIGVAASGTTAYVIGALKGCKQSGIATGAISCNLNSPISALADFPIEAVVGPEIVTGSTRMKSGTAQKLILNMISTAVMIQIGRVEGNKMVNMQLTNEKLVDRGVKMLMEKTSIEDYDKARSLLLKFGSVKKAMDSL